MIPLLLGNWPRVVAWGAAIVAALTVTWMHGYTRGEIKLFEYQAQQATKKVAVVVKIKEADNAALKKLRGDNAHLRQLYDDAKRADSLSSIAGAGTCGDPRAGLPAVPGNGDQAAADPMPDPRRMLDDVENAVLAILAAGDTEIAKCRRLFERDETAAEIAK